MPIITNRPTRAEISLSALKQNFSVARDLSGSAAIMAVVKAEAYGHGLVRASQLFADCGADYLGVSFLEEGVSLRGAGIKTPILVMGGLVDEQIERYIDYDLELTVSSVWKAHQVNAAAEKRGIEAAVQLKIDTGMGRIGQQWQTADKLFLEITRLKNIQVKGIYTHLATADGENPEFADTQLNRFDEVLEQARSVGINPPYTHAVGSSGLVIPEMLRNYSMIRPGLMLYGYSPVPGLQDQFDIRPAMTLKTRVVYVKYPPEGTTIGYGATWKSPGKRWIATLPIGYGDGYPRRFGNCGWVMMRKHRCPVVGRVSMDQITIDAGHEAYLGDEAILFGGSGNNSLPLWELCKAINVIPYELLCGLTARVPRVYIE